MDGDRTAASRYRERAEEVRAIAADMKTHGAREILVGIAESYERMARQRDESAELDDRLATVHAP